MNLMLLASVLLAFHANSPLERPRDVWVFRSVLDKRARMVTLNLKDDFFMAYDATNCGLYKAWNGTVKLEGSVYTTEHGPQPTSDGTSRYFGVADKPVWSLSYKGQTFKPRWRGYRFVEDQVMFQYEFQVEKNKSIWVRETPEATDNGWTREFYVDSLGDAKLTLDMGAFAAGNSGQIFYNNKAVQGNILTLSEGRSTLKVEMAKAIHTPVIPEAWQANLKAVFNASTKANQDGETTPLTEGVALRVYDIGQRMSSIPTLIAGQSPNYSVIKPNINFSTEEDFGGLKDWFYAEVTAFLNIEQEGEYVFRLSSDDGSRMILGNKIIINNDGLHGAEPPADSTPILLKKGLHPIRIEFFEGEVDNVLKLSWKKPGDTQFSIVPSSAFRTPRGEVKVTAPGKKAIVDPAQRDRPGDGQPLNSVHPSFDLATVRPAEFRPRVGGIAFLPDNRMVVCNWEPDGGVYILDGVTDKDPRPSVKRIAFGLAEPLGITVVNNEIYVLQKQELTKLIDRDGDEIIDEYFCVADGWGVTNNFHEFAFGLIYENGYFYGNLATAINPGGTSTRPQNPDRGKVIRIDGKTGDFEFVAEGLRTPNGIGFGYKNRIFITDNQGDWLPSSKLLPYVKGAFYGNRAVDPEGTANKPVTPPVVWLPQGEIGNSPSNPTYLNIGPYKDQMIHGDVTHGGVKRVFVEEVNGVLQGCVFPFTQGLEGGVNRIFWGPDKSLYVGGIGSSGNWGQEGKERFGLQRLTYNGKVTFEMLAIRVFKNGFEVEFTEPVANGIGNDPADYTIRQWRYVPTDAYGGPKIDEEALEITGLRWSKDRKKVFLEIKDLKEDHVQLIRLGHGFHNTKGEPIWATNAWYTLNKLPNRTQKADKVNRPTTLTREEKAQGFVSLFDGKDASNFVSYGSKAPLGSAWVVRNGELVLDKSKGRGGDIMTKEEYADFELRLEWAIEAGGNSGIMYRVKNDPSNPPHATGPEYQLLDDATAPDGRNTLTSSASLYALRSRTWDMLRPAGAWNETRIVMKDGLVEHWLNGALVVSYEWNSQSLRTLIEKSKFAGLKEFMALPKGHIVLQDHGNEVRFRNIRIRKL